MAASRWRKVFVLLLLALVLILTAVGLGAHRAWRDFLREQGIERLEWEGLDLSGKHLRLAQLSITQAQPGHQLKARVHELRLDWQWRGFKPRFTRLGFAELQLSHHKLEARLEDFNLTGTWPQLERLQLAQLTLDWQPGPGASSGQAVAGIPQTPEVLPGWLPREVNIQHWSARLPCETGFCPLSGHLSLEWLPPSEGQVVHWQALAGRADIHLGLPEPWPLPRDSRLEGKLQLALQWDAGQWQGRLTDARLTFQWPQGHQSGWVFQKLNAELALSGEADNSGIRLGLGKGSHLQLAQLKPLAGNEPDSEPRLRDLSLGLQGLEVSADFGEGAGLKSIDWADLFTNLEAQGPLELALGELQAPYLKPQSWEFAGDVVAGAGQARLTGELHNRAGLGIGLTLDYPFGGQPVAQAQWADQGESGARSLAQTLSDWPRELTVSDGHLATQARLGLSPEGDYSIEGEVQLDALSGIYDRTAWTGLTGQLDFSLQGEQLEFQTPELHLETLNPGISAGPLELAGRYQTTLDQPLGGRLRLDRARLALFGGELWLEPDGWQLADRPLRFPILFKQLELAKLMQAYPTEGLAGTGRLNGELPVLIDEEGISLAQGRLAAQEPGGTLELPADSVRALSRANQTTELVAQALQNFHYSVLNSSIDYTQDGTLLLGLHLKGKSPSLPGDRPVILNINLEEDLPALLTSLQLSGRVNEAVTRKVREMMRQRED